MKWFAKNVKSQQMVYCNNHTVEGETDEEIIKAALLHPQYYKFRASEFMDAGHVKNDSRLFYSTPDNKVWQVCGRATDMVDFIIPNVYLVREIGIWGETNIDMKKKYIGKMDRFDGLTTGETYRVVEETETSYVIPMNDCGGTSTITKDKFE